MSKTPKIQNPFAKALNFKYIKYLANICQTQ
jgi:hypothetical protein